MYDCVYVYICVYNSICLYEFSLSKLKLLMKTIYVCLLSIISLHLRRRCDWSEKCLRIEETTSEGCAFKKKKQILAKHHTFPNHPLINTI